MHVAIRADASHLLGSGHVMRCVALADLLAKRGAVISFVCRELDGHYCDWLEMKGFAVHRLTTSVKLDGSKTTELVSKILGAPMEVEIEQSTRALRAIGKIDWLIVDHYALDAQWEAAMRPCARRILAIDDLADRNHDVDVLLDQNLQSDMMRYASRVSESCVRLLGPSFALLRSDFRSKRSSMRRRDGRVRRAIIFVGGSDPHNYTAKILDAWKRASTSELILDVAVGGATPNRSDLERRCAAIPNAQLHIQTSEMAELMAQADMMIGGAGSTTWERCCLGLPSILVSIAANQREIGRMVAERGAATYLGDLADVTQDDLALAISSLVDDPERMRLMSANAFDIVDGLGCDRVAASVCERLKISIVSDANSWINDYMPEFVEHLKDQGHHVSTLHDPLLLESGDCAFFLSCGKLVNADVLARNVHNLVVHESSLPAGRGWSPLTWQILEGKNSVPITLFEAEAKVDSGSIYLEEVMQFSGHELIDELRAEQAKKTILLCHRFIMNYPAIVGRRRAQEGEPSYYPRRRAEDSRLDVDLALREQFNLFRVVDNDRYPAFFEIDGFRYRLLVSRDQQ